MQTCRQPLLVGIIFGARTPYPNTMASLLQDSLFGHQIQFHNHLVSIRIEKNNVDKLYWLELFLVPENPILIRLTPYQRIVFSGTKFSYMISWYPLEYKKIMQKTFIGLNYFWCPKTLPLYNGLHTIRQSFRAPNLVSRSRGIHQNRRK